MSVKSPFCMTVITRWCRTSTVTQGSDWMTFVVDLFTTAIDKHLSVPLQLKKKACAHLKSALRKVLHTQERLCHIIFTWMVVKAASVDTWTLSSFAVTESCGFQDDTHLYQFTSHFGRKRILLDLVLPPPEVELLEEAPPSDRCQTNHQCPLQIVGGSHLSIDNTSAKDIPAAEDNSLMRPTRTGESDEG